MILLFTLISCDICIISTCYILPNPQIDLICSNFDNTTLYRLSAISPVDNIFLICSKHSQVSVIDWLRYHIGI